MADLTLTQFVTLDGVVQAPGGPDEDRSDGFTLNGWLWPHADERSRQCIVEPKYVASRTLKSVAWSGAELLRENVVEAVAALKAEKSGQLQIHGSGKLAQSLISAGLIDEIELMVFPVVLGSGKRLFENVTPSAFTLIGSQVTSRGVAIHTYRFAGKPQFSAKRPEPRG